MNRFTVYSSALVLSVMIFGFGMRAALADTYFTQDAGGFSGIIDSPIIVQSGGPSNGSTMWTEQDVTSTFTGLVSSFSIVVKGGYNIGGLPFTGELYNTTNPSYGIGYHYDTDVCDDSHDITGVVTSTDCVLTFELGQAVTTTAGDVMTMKIDTQRYLSGKYNHFYGAIKPRDGTWVGSRIHLLNSGSGNTVTWDAYGIPYSDNQLAWAWNLSTTTTPPEPPPCTENCNSNILFLPGIEGSRLYDEEEKRWEPGALGGDDDLRALYMDSDGVSIGTDIYTNGVIDRFSVSQWGVELRHIDIYKSFLDDLESWKNTEHIIKNYAAVPYDWRLSPEEIVNKGNELSTNYISYVDVAGTTSTPYIEEMLRTLAASSTTGKVTIVAHSYGGLVAKALIKKLQDTSDSLLEKIDNLVLVGVPQTGTPHAIGAGLHGFDLGIPADGDPIFVVHPEVAREFASTTPMFYSLLPWDAYATGTSSFTTTPPITFVDGTATQMFTSFYGNVATSTFDLYSFFSGAEGRPQAAYSDLHSPSILSSPLLIAAENAHYGIDNLVIPTSTKVYQIAGWGEDTVAQIQYYDASGTLKYLPRIALDGDGTVVIPSALAMSTSTSNVTRWWLNLREYNADTASSSRRNHKDLFEVPALNSFIKNNIVTHSTTTLPEFISADQPYFDPNEKHLHFFLHSPLALSAKDPYGNEISQTTTTIPGAIYRNFGEVQYISLPASSTPNLSLKGYATGSFTLDVEEFSGNRVITTNRFSAISSVTSTKASISFPDGTILHASPLSVDRDGDGENDSIYLSMPAVSVKQGKLDTND